MVMLWSADLLLWMDESMCFQGRLKGEYVVDVEYVVFVHEWRCVCSGRFFEGDSDDFLVYSVKWLEVLFRFVVASPDGDGIEEVWVDVGIVVADECFLGENFAYES